MFDTTIKHLLALFPKGATNDQLIWRLSSAGVKVSASELLASLTILAERGDIVRDSYGRWRAALPTELKPPMPANGRPANGSEAGVAPDVLYAVPAICRALPALQVEETQTPIANGSIPPWPNLFSYYAATQRKDPRGQIEEFLDRHSSSWQLFHASGQWWANAAIHIRMDCLPEVFREALSRQKITSAAVGWPVSLFQTSLGTTFVPALLIPIDFRIQGEILILEVEALEPSINPAWVREVRRKTSWGETALLERLFPEGEDSDLASIADRLRHSLATIGGASLRPVNLEREISVAAEGLRNAAALFLSEDAAFSKATAEDLETIANWAPEKRLGTALTALVSEKAQGNPTDVIPLTPTRSVEKITDSQLEAADAALTGPLTVIQGPPGTGKSEVILSLIVSVVMAGKTALFAAKNHQALDEIEHRMKELIPDCPILVRGRDADGERNTNFLEVLFELAHAETNQSSHDIKLEPIRTALLKRAEKWRSQRDAYRQEVKRNVALSDAVERLDILRRSLGKPSGSSLKTGWLRRLIRAISSSWRKKEDVTTALPEFASIKEIEARIASLETELRKREKEPIAPNEASSAKDLSDEIKSLLPRFLEFVAKPSESEWRWISQRARELEFENARSARRLAPEDARSVLRHRPVWAISTLSAPARIPLIPALFDYVIFDEASQCDIASAVPLLARARKAVVVGDPMQLRFIPQLGRSAEHALMDAAGIPLSGRASIAQSANSLFDFCERRPSASRVFLADQFRSAPHIVDYLNGDFYQGKLINRTSADSFRTPGGYRPGLSWEDVAGYAVRKDDGTINEAEAARIGQVLRRIADDPNYEGSIGIISPFNAQVAILQKVIQKAFSPAELERLSVKVSTIDKFQGGESDVILFSLVLAASAPHSAWTFLQKERRRLNVAVSRARALCIIFGDLAYARSCGVKHIEFLAKRATTPFIPHRPQQFDSDWERRLDTAMRGRGLSPIPQHPVGTRFLDFALDPDGIKLNVEVDGRRWHTDSIGNRKVADRLRDSELRSRGWTVLRFWVHQLANDMEGCLDSIERALGRGRSI